MEIVLFVFAIFAILANIGGLIRLLMYWMQFDRVYGPGYPVGMLLVTLFVPLGGLWPLFAPLNRRKVRQYNY